MQQYSFIYTNVKLETEHVIRTDKEQNKTQSLNILTQTNELNEHQVRTLIKSMSNKGTN